MNKEKGSRKKEGGLFNHSLRMVAGLYLVYMAYKMIVQLRAGTLGEVHPALAISMAAVFVLSGGYIFWKSFQADMAERKQAKAEKDASSEEE